MLLAFRLWTPPASEAGTHCPASKLQLPAQVGAIRKKSGDRGASISIVPCQRFINLVSRLGVLYFERAHVVVPLCLCHSRHLPLGFRLAAASPVCSQYVLAAI